eukprot:TRINITY_DN27733_c0_g1_i2.p1 TRINITY_DN27733_c0_g1~~TRINITY_DN27733_c0_g1_i2.p1  ORF type:complete len:106 (-),score=30.53 TRINITY_DN27733_c0_g1_i2:73-354(-)
MCVIAGDICLILVSSFCFYFFFFFFFNEDELIQIDLFIISAYNSSIILSIIKEGVDNRAVSYTHLTLPTILLVQISVVAVSLKKKKDAKQRIE